MPEIPQISRKLVENGSHQPPFSSHALLPRNYIVPRLRAQTSSTLYNQAGDRWGD